MFFGLIRRLTEKKESDWAGVNAVVVVVVVGKKDDTFFFFFLVFPNLVVPPCQFERHPWSAV